VISLPFITATGRRMLQRNCVFAAALMLLTPDYYAQDVDSINNQPEGKIPWKID
jgi:hypothetical protein